MPRALRIEYAGALYHIMARGNQGQKICDDDGDRRMWRATLGEACRRTGWHVHAWVLMTNHYHLLLETPEPNLVTGMKWLQGTYTQRYNTRHRQRGHLFQGRYRSVPVASSEPEYARAVSTYIHLNPVRARLIRTGEQKLWEYPWSSYPAYAHRGVTPPEWLVTERVMSSMGLSPGNRRDYEVYMEARVFEIGRKEKRSELEEQWRELRRGWYFGKEEFRLDLLARLKGVLARHRTESYSGLAKQEHGVERAERMLEEGLRALRLRRQDLAVMPKGQIQKQVLAWWLCEHTTAPRRWVSERLGMGHASRVTQALSCVNNRRDQRLEKLKERLSQLTS